MAAVTPTMLALATLGAAVVVTLVAKEEVVVTIPAACEYILPGSPTQCFRITIPHMNTPSH
jgi:hypothetical protein